MQLRSTVRTLTVIAFTLLAAFGCKQGEGEPCDVDEDCADGLTCCDELRRDHRGICQPVGASCDEFVPRFDAGPRSDAGRRDSGSADAGGEDGGEEPEDAGPVDSGPVDSGPGDSGPPSAEDAGPEDAGETVEDAGEPDAGE